MAFLETLIKWEESSPLDVARALREADAFAAHHEDLARYARGLAGRIAQETGGFTGDEFSLDSSAPHEERASFERERRGSRRSDHDDALGAASRERRGSQEPRHRGSVGAVQDAPSVVLTAPIGRRCASGSENYVDKKARAMIVKECRERGKARGSLRAQHPGAPPHRGPGSPASPPGGGAAGDRRKLLAGGVGRGSFKLKVPAVLGLAPQDDRAQERARQRKVLTLNGGNVGEWLDYIRSAEDATPHELEMLQMRDDTWLDAALRVVFPVLSYNSSWLLFWQLAMVLCVVYVSVSVPIVIAWGTHALLRSGRCVRWMHHVDLFVDVFFLADIALTFFTSYVDEVTAEEVTDRRCIAYRYVFDPFAGKWIVFDAIASLPTSFFGCAGGGILEYVKFIRFTKLFKMLRMLKINSIVDTRHMPFFHPVMMRFMRILLGLLFVWHLFACLYWRVARSEEYWSTGCDPAAFSCWIPPKRVRDAPFFRQYSYAPPRAYLWGSIHSFGSVFAVPTTTRTMWTTASVAIVGLVVNAIVIGSATNVLRHSIAKQHQKRKDGVNHYMRWQNFPPETAHITTPNETILREGDHGDLLFFLVHGEALAYCDGDEGDRKKALLRAAKARVARRRLLAAKGGVIAGKPLAREAALLHEVLRRNTAASAAPRTSTSRRRPLAGPARRRSTASAAAWAAARGSGPPGSSPPAGWRRQLQSSDGPAADDGDRRDGVARKTLMRTMTDTVKFVLRSRSFKNQSLDRVGVVHGDAYVAEEARDDGGGDDDDQHVILLSVLKIGAVIGEIALLSEDEKRTASVLTTQHCELYSLDAENFNFISSHAVARDPCTARSSVTWSKQMKALVNDDVSPDDAAARDGQSHWDYMKQTKVAPTLSAAGDMLRNSSRGIDRVHRISREINDRLRSSSLRRSKNNGDATDGAAANGGTDAPSTPPSGACPGAGAAARALFISLVFYVARGRTRVGTLAYR
ncbi:voltage-gated potassium channel [Aureococcus anophagefferens]|nr:voltage-gated potassium channel [Aureococcus anophagefferens]